MISALTDAVSIIMTPAGVLMLLAGSVVGLVFGMLPGLGASQAMILLLPFTYGADPHYAILLFVAVMSSASFGGSLPAILINTPGTPANVCTTFDGYPMARRGEAARAIVVSGLSCLVGSIVGAMALFSLIPVISHVITAFGARETFWLVVFGIAMISLSAKGNTLKGLVAGGFGLLLAFVGRNYVFPGERFTFGIDFLYDGVPMAALLVGMFAVVPMVFLGAKRSVVDTGLAEPTVLAAGFRSQARRGALDVWRYRYGALRGSVLGVLLGIIPAVGGATASFVNYLMSKQLSRNGSEFGKGSPEGLIASETANDAKDGGALMPTLAFGIPGDPNTAVLLGALLMHGVALGRPLFDNNLPMVVIIVLGLVLGQILVSVFGVLTGPFISRITTISSYYLVPVVVTCALIGSYLFRNNVWDTTIVVIAAVFGYCLTQFNYPVISLVLGFLLGVEAERAFIQTLIMSQGSYAGLFEGGVVWGIITIMVLSFLGAWAINKRRAVRAGVPVTVTGPSGAEAGETGDAVASDMQSVSRSAAGGGASSNGEGQPGEELPGEEQPGRPRLGREQRMATGFAAVLLAAGLAFFIGSRGYEGDMGLFPGAVSGLVCVLLVIVLASEMSPRLRTALAKIDGGADAFQANGTSDLSAAALRKHGRVLAWAAAFTAAMIYAGFLAFPVMITAYIWRTGRATLKPALIIGAAMAVLLVVFGTAAPTMFWTGALPELIPDLLGGGRIPALF
ncbi:tripartite tricarboxylate transporter permease [Phytoactinopolyspora limicola]|uniref:tripartite tricarboxylate transporter permease n=1 Tax=Phytoactinopolyspora limicola TaxID=2715536 RepID=UPI00140CD3E0|nr:tripartite tricarboxylate transporter permease [Phytoactinopolyspora limicola]